MKLSACMIVLNEIDTLPACLRTLVGYVDEIVIVDTGSTDGTQYLVQAWNAAYGNNGTKFVIESYIDWKEWSFSDARNYAMSKASGDWLFTIDADDRVEIEDWDQLLKFLRADPDDVGDFDFVACDILNVYGSKAKVEGSLTQPRFFRASSKPKYVGRVHNNITFPDLGRPDNAIRADFKIYHTGYGMISKEAMDTKVERVIEMTKADTEASPDSAYAWFNLGNALKSRMAQKEWTDEDKREAIAALDKAMTLAKNTQNHTFIDAVSLKGWILYQSKDFDGADLCADTAIKEKRDHVDAILLKAYSNADADRLDIAEYWLKQYLIANDKLAQVGNYDYVSCQFRGHKAQVYQALAAIELRRADTIDRRRALLMK